MNIQKYSNTIWDLIVVGAGVSGSFLGYQMAKEGASVLIVDKNHFPRDKVCGCCVNAAGVGMLKNAGLQTMLRSCDAPELNKLAISNGKRQVNIPLPGGVAISRAKLDSSLIAAAVQAGAHFLPGTLASPQGVNSQIATVYLNNRQFSGECSARVLVSAEGLSGNFLQKVLGKKPLVALDSLVGAGATLNAPLSDYPEGTIYMAIGKEGYLGVVRTEGSSLNLAAALDVAYLKRDGGVKGSARALLGNAGFPWLSGFDDLHWKGTAMLTRKSPTVAGNRIFAVGDSASYVEPFTGEGMTWALLSVEALKPLLKEAIEKWNSGLSTAWQDKYSKTIRPKQKATSFVSRILRRPLLCDTSLRLLSAFPALATPFTSTRNMEPDAS